MLSLAAILWLTQLEQNLDAWSHSLGWPAEGLFRLLMAAVAGGLVGLERELRGRQAGFRTYLLVALGSAVVMVISTKFADFAWQHPSNVNLAVDPARMAYGVMTGIGFLGAGVIVHSHGSVRGLTTAAGIWCVAAIGLAIGFGHFTFGLIAAVMVVAALWVLDYVEKKLPKTRYRIVTVRTPWAANCVADTIKRFKSAGFKVVDAHFERTYDLKHVDVNLSIAFFSNEKYFSFERQLEVDPSCELIATREM